MKKIDFIATSALAFVLMIMNFVIAHNWFKIGFNLPGDISVATGIVYGIISYLAFRLVNRVPKS